MRDHEKDLPTLIAICKLLAFGGIDSLSFIESRLALCHFSLKDQSLFADNLKLEMSIND